MKTLFLFFILPGCYPMNHAERFPDTRHNIVESDSLVYHGKILYRVFKCANDCGFFDTFPNPAVDEAIRGYRKLKSIEATVGYNPANK